MNITASEPMHLFQVPQYPSLAVHGPPVRSAEMPVSPLPSPFLLILAALSHQSCAVETQRSFPLRNVM